MLLKASKSNLTLFKQHFCENPSKFANLADFATFFLTTLDLFFYVSFFYIIYGEIEHKYGTFEPHKSFGKKG